MSLIKCHECGHDVSTEADACPSCGAKPRLSPKITPARKVFGALLLLGFVVLVVNSLTNGTNTPVSSTTSNYASTDSQASAQSEDQPAELKPILEKAIYKISAQDLHAEYEKNEVAADNELKGKIIEISGTIVGIDKDFMDKVVIRFATSNEFESAQMTMAKSEDADAAKLSKGLNISVQCPTVKRIMGAPVGDGCVFVRDNVKADAQAPPEANKEEVKPDAMKRHFDHPTVLSGRYFDDKFTNCCINGNETLTPYSRLHLESTIDVIDDSGELGDVKNVSDVQIGADDDMVEGISDGDNIEVTCKDLWQGNTGHYALPVYCVATKVSLLAH